MYLLSERDIVFINENNTLDVVGDSTYISTLGWNDLKQIERMNYRIVGLKNDGTVDVSDYYYKSSLFANDEPAFIDKVKSWTNIVNIAVLTGGDNSYIFGLKMDGTIVVACKDESNNKYGSVELWTNVEKIVGNSTTYGLYGITKDGKLLYSSN